ncbi:MAG: class I SAM-dependent methyltransferase [Candidatus Algichlamydia australiensis]|nr:class I SAM-dependent methyltransferase [Chlamydiales bacterium]
MKRFICALGFLPALFASEIYDLKSHGHPQYQDIFLNGEVVSKASGYERFEEKRFAVLDSILSRYTRPFTMLDVGASQGYFTFRAADKYPEGIFVMLEGSNYHYPKISQQLRSICRANTNSKNVIWLDRSIYAKDFARMATCEHFDVILAQNILHWFKDDWEILLNSFLQMSHVTIIELPPNDCKKGSKQYLLRNELHAHLSETATQVLEGVPRHTNPRLKTTYYIFINEKGETNLQRNSMVHGDYKDRDHLITFDFEAKKFIKRDHKPPFMEECIEWEPGINLLTYLCLNGQYPQRDVIANLLPINRNHKDWMPNNMILQGHKLTLIDFDDWKNERGGFGQNCCSKARIEKLKRLIRHGDEQKVKEFLWGKKKK